jgi:hypothetical protein
MGNKTLLLVAVGAVAGFFWWMARPVQGGTKINAVAGLRG